MNQLSKQGLYDTISTDFILAGVKMRLGLKDSTSEDIYLIDIINRGIKRLRNLGTMIPAIATVPIYDYKAELPDGFIKFTKSFPIRLFNPEDLVQDSTLFSYTQSTEEGRAEVNTTVDVAMQHVFSNNSRGNIPIFLNGAFYDGLGNLALEGIDISTPYITVNIANGYMYFSSNCDFSYAKISFLSNNMDEEGYLLAPAYCEEALTEFALWTYKTDNADRYPAYIIQQHGELWKSGKAHCKAIAAMPNSEDTQFIARKVNSLI